MEGDSRERRTRALSRPLSLLSASRQLGPSEKMGASELALVSSSVKLRTPLVSPSAHHCAISPRSSTSSSLHDNTTSIGTCN